MNRECAIEVSLDDLEEVHPTPSLNLFDFYEEGCYRPKGGGSYMLFCCRPLLPYPQPCTVCKSKNTTIHGYLSEPRLVHDVNVGVDQVDILVKVPRYRCNDCGATSSHEFHSIMNHRQMTRRLYDQIRRDSFVHTFSDVAARYGYSVPTIAGIFDEYASELELRREEIVAPRVLGLDEKHIVHAMRGVFVDIETGTLLEMTTNNKRADIIGAIESMVDYDKNIELVTMDMSNGYRSYVQECLPRAKIIADKYHVFQDLATKVSKTKTRLTEYLKAQIAQIDDPTEKMHKQKVLTTANSNTYLFKFGQEKLIEKETRIKAMADVCQTFPELNHLRLLKENFELIYDCEDRISAEAVYAEWVKLVPPSGSNKMAAWQEQYQVPPDLYSEFRTLMRTINSWREEVFGYFDPGCRVTNAATEGLNNMIERFNRQGNGYSFERLRAKALFWHLAAPRTHYSLVYKKMPVPKKNAPTKPRDAVSDNEKVYYKVVGSRGTPDPLIDFVNKQVITESVDVSKRKPLSVFSFLDPDYMPL